MATTTTGAQIDFDHPRTEEEAVLAAALDRATLELVTTSADARSWWQGDEFTESFFTHVTELAHKAELAQGELQLTQLAEGSNRALRLARAAVRQQFRQHPALAEIVARAYLSAWDETFGHHRALEPAAWEYAGTREEGIPASANAQPV